MLPTIVRKRNYASPSIFDELFNNSFIPSSYSSGFSRSSLPGPAVNVQENENEFRIDVAAPGLEKNELKVSVEEGILNISFEQNTEQEEKTDGYLRKEFSASSFSRSFKLPDEVEAEKISAKHKNGVLSIHLPKTEVKVSPAKEIKIG